MRFDKRYYLVEVSVWFKTNIDGTQPLKDNEIIIGKMILKEDKLERRKPAILDDITWIEIFNERQPSMEDSL